ncbi:MAG: hypothetical protein ACTHN5_21560 [Phycisphaerae bacterium]
MAKSKSSSRRSQSRSSTGGRSKAANSGSRSSGRSSARSGGRTSRSAKRTTDHEEIRRWVEEHGGRPATVRGTERGGEEAGLLRIDFPGGAGPESLETIEWDEFFDKFEESNLAFLYQESKRGDPSRFTKFVSRSPGEVAKGRTRTKSRSSRRRNPKD